MGFRKKNIEFGKEIERIVKKFANRQKLNFVQ